MSPFIFKYWKPLAVVAAIAGSFVAGRLLVPEQPARVEYKDRIVEKEVTTESQKAMMTAFENLRLEMEKVRETQVVERYHREVLETKLADGTYTKKVTVDKNIDSHTKETETKVEIKVVEVEKKVETIRTEYVDKVVEKNVIVDNKRNWRVSPMVGVDLKQILTGVKVVGGASVERRILGSIWLGGWGLSSGEAGIKAAVEF